MAIAETCEQGMTNVPLGRLTRSSGVADLTIIGALCLASLDDFGARAKTVIQGKSGIDVLSGPDCDKLLGLFSAIGFRPRSGFAAALSAR